MPCENCNTQFTVFKRKKSCFECRRLFCSSCLLKRKGIILCEKCVVFKKRPLSKIELSKLKPKDLIFYLQSKHISTTGCVEKDELVNLVIAHVNSNCTENLNSPNYSTSSSSSPSFSNHNENPFDSIKQTCQNLFTSFTEKIASDLNFDGNGKHTSASSSTASSNRNNYNNNNSNNNQNVFSQPRQSSNNKPYDSSYNSDVHSRQHSASNSSHLSVGVSPTAQNYNGQQANIENVFKFSNSCHSNIESPQPSTSGQINTNNIRTKIHNETPSSSSSFEELGAVGGNNAFSGPEANTSNSSDTTDNWQFIQNHNLDSNSKNKHKNLSALNLPSFNVFSHQLHNKITRRRSDTYILEQNSLSHILDINHDIDCPAINKRSKRCCRECGHTKIEIKNIIKKFRHQLESIKNLTEIEKQRKMDEFLKTIESRCLFDNNFSPTLELQLNNNRNVTENIETETQLSPYQGGISNINNTNSVEGGGIGDDDEGIYVYPTMSYMFDEHSSGNGTFQHEIRHRLKLTDISSKSDLKDLSVKQLKEILMLNRVDFKGCCEKTELLERVYRLWRDYKSTPAVEKLTTEDLCKICMDAPIECVILECGHMVTCTNCGKVLNECPICRQYIVRVVRFFRA